MARGGVMPLQIPIEELIPLRWYVGRGRNSNVGRWDGKHFLTITGKLGEDVVKLEPYYADQSGCFQPFALIDEGEVVEPFGRVGWDAHYGRRLEFGTEPKDGFEAMRKRLGMDGVKKPPVV